MKTYSWKVSYGQCLPSAKDYVPKYGYVRAKTLNQAIEKAKKKFKSEFVVILNPGYDSWSDNSLFKFWRD